MDSGLRGRLTWISNVLGTSDSNQKLVLLSSLKDQTPLLSSSGTRKVVSEDTHQPVRSGEVHLPKDIIARRIQEISAGSNKGRKSDHCLVVREGYPLKTDYTWEPIENLYGQEEQW